MKRIKKPTPKMRLYIWVWGNESRSWEEAIVLASSEQEARELVLADGSFMHTECIAGPPTEVKDYPAVVYNCY